MVSEFVAENVQNTNECCSLHVLLICFGKVDAIDPALTKGKTACLVD